MNRNTLQKQRGSVFIVVLWVCLGLVALVLTFGNSMLLGFRSSDEDLAGRQAEMAIESAVRYAETVIINTATPGVAPDVSTYQSEAVPVGDAKFWFIGRDNNNVNANATKPVYGLVDEASKLNVNTATEAMLEGLPGLTQDLAASIFNWRSSQDQGIAGGAETDQYMQLQPAYTCKNASFETTEELALIYQMDMTTLYGEDANLNGALDPNEDDGAKNDPPDNSNGQLDPGILEYLTAFSKEPNTKSDGTNKINVSTINNDLYTNLTPLLDAAALGKVRSNLGNGGPPIRSVLEFYLRSKLTADEFSKIADSITVNSGQYVNGLVNVYTASQTVLSCIPGITLNDAASLINARQNQAVGSTSITWVADTLGAAAAVQAGPYITGRSYQFMADVAAVGRNGRGFRRVRFIIDTSSGTPKVIYRRSISHLGWALGADARKNLSVAH